MYEKTEGCVYMEQNNENKPNTNVEETNKPNEENVTNTNVEPTQEQSNAKKKPRNLLKMSISKKRQMKQKTSLFVSLKNHYQR